MGYEEQVANTYTVSELNQGQVTYQIKRQNGLLEELDKAVGGLYERLSEVTQEREREQDELASPREALVPIASRIESNNDSIISATERLGRLTGFIEL